MAPSAVCLQRARCPPCNTINWNVAQATDISSDIEERDREAMLAKVIDWFLLNVSSYVRRECHQLHSAVQIDYSCEMI